MLNLRWSLLLGASLSSLAWFGCSSDPESTPSGTGGGSAAGGNKATGGGSAMGGGKATGGGSAMGGATAKGSAPEATVDAIKAFIMAGTYKSAPWKSDVAAPRAQKPGTGHGDTSVRVWFNDTIQKSAATHNFHDPVGQGVSPVHDTGSMVVKEFYTGTNVVGHAAMLKVDPPVPMSTPMQAFVYYCDGPAALCANPPGGDTAVKPYFATGQAASCGMGCHFGNVFTHIP